MFPQMSTKIQRAIELILGTAGALSLDVAQAESRYYVQRGHFTLLIIEPIFPHPGFDRADSYTFDLRIQGPLVASAAQAGSLRADTYRHEADTIFFDRVDYADGERIESALGLLARLLMYATR